VRSGQPVFYYDLGDPECYLVAERIMSELTVVPEWEPVLTVLTATPGRETDREGIERRARDFGLQPLRWPDRWPPDSRTAMLAATYAKQIGRAVAFSLAAFRQTFAGGRDLGDESTVLLAAAACEMHPTAVLKGLSTKSVQSGLDRAGERARAAGATALPAIGVGEALWQGRDCIERAEAALGVSR
jgi:2-hydroxychromene-2-carboxylate isomerase